MYVISNIKCLYGNSWCMYVCLLVVASDTPIYNCNSEVITFCKWHIVNEFSMFSFSYSNVGTKAPYMKFAVSDLITNSHLIENVVKLLYSGKGMVVSIWNVICREFNSCFAGQWQRIIKETNLTTSYISNVLILGIRRFQILIYCRNFCNWQPNIGCYM